MTLEEEVFKLTIKEVLPCGGVLISLRVRGDKTWMFFENFPPLHEGQSLIFCDGQEEDNDEGLPWEGVSFPRETWTKVMEDESFNL